MRQLRALLLLLSLGASGPARAQDGGAGAADDAGAPREPIALLRDHLQLLARQELTPPPATRVEELSELLEQAHQLGTSGREDQAIMALLEAVEGPRFRSFEALDSFAAADLMLASLLLDQRALGSAQRSVDRLLARGKDSALFAPAYRRGVDVALARGDYAASARHLQIVADEELPPDAADERHYLLALAALDAADHEAVRRELSAVSTKSRFYARAQYLLGAEAAGTRDYDEADRRFCAVRALLHGMPRARLASSRFDATEDLAQLGRARIAHEQGQGRRASQLYFAVPNDSPLLAQALFEAAYANYEAARPELALDNLAQLEARYPRSPYTAEARVLRGYLHLASCDFARAEADLIEFERTFGALLQELDAVLASEGSTRSLFTGGTDSLLGGLLMRDPRVEQLRAQLDALSGELARGARLPEDLAALAVRVRGEDLPRTRRGEGAQVMRVARLHERGAQLRDALRVLGDELRQLRAAGAHEKELSALLRAQRTLAAGNDRVAASLRALTRREARGVDEPPRGEALAARIEQDRRYWQALHARALRLRERLEQALSASERRALSGLRERVEAELRRARIGRIDALMGKKRKLELEVESLHAGRFPPELPSRAQRPVLLRDDEEYWPYEGEDWPDEREARP